MLTDARPRSGGKRHWVEVDPHERYAQPAPLSLCALQPKSGWVYMPGWTKADCAECAAAKEKS